MAFPPTAEDEATDPQLEAQREAEGLMEEPAEPEAPPEAVQYGAQDNLAASLPEEYLQKVGAKVIDQAMRDHKSMKPWRDKVAQYMSMYNGEAAEAVPGQENLTPVHLPFFKRGVRMFHSKLFPALFPPSGEFFSLKVRSPHLEEAAWKCSVHMNSALVNECVEYIPSHDRGMTSNLIQGCIFEGWVWDAAAKRPRNEIALADDFWISYSAKCDTPDMPGLRKTWRLYYHQHELEQLEADGYYVGVTSGESPLYPPESYDEAGAPTGGSMGKTDEMDDRPVKERQDAFVGQEEPSDDPEAPRQVLEQDRMLRLPGEKMQRAVTICVDKASAKVLRLVLREKEDPIDKRRWKAEMEARDAEMQAAAAQFEADMMAFEQSQQPQVDPMTGAPLPVDWNAIPPQMPMPPMEPPEPAPVKRIPWERWTKYDCQVNPAGALGLGLGQDLYGHNRLADKIASRAASLMNMALMPTGFVSRQSRIARGDITLKLGQLTEVNLSPREVQDGAGIHQFQFPYPQPGWEKVIEQQDKSCQEVTAFDIAMGAPGMSGETATESENRHSAATSNISVIGSRYNRARAYSLRNMAYIYSQTLPPEGVTIFVDQDLVPPELQPPPPMMPPAGMDMAGPPMPGEMDMTEPPGMGGMDSTLPPGAPPPQMMGPPPPQPPQQPVKVPVVVTREDYEAILDEMEVVFTCDPQMESQAVKERRAMKLWQTALQVAQTPVDPMGTPLLDPSTTVMILRGIASSVFDSMEKKDIGRAIKNAPLPQPPPPMPPGPPGEGNGEGPGPGMENGPPGVPGDSGGEGPPPDAA